MNTTSYNQSDTKSRPTFFKKYEKIRSSIYGQVIYSILILSIFLFLLFGIIFRSVNERFMERVIYQNGFNVGHFVQGALYHSMLENDKAVLQNTLDVINRLPNIDEVNMYNEYDSLVYTTQVEDSLKRIVDFKGFFGEPKEIDEKSYVVLDSTDGLGMFGKYRRERHLLIRSPILNEPSCMECHWVHHATDVVLGSLIIKIPLNELDSALRESSVDFFILATIMTLLLLAFLVLFTTKNIRKPLNAIVLASEAVASGDKKMRLNVQPNQLSDIRTVSIAFNNMLDNLEKANIELQNWSQQLEHKVQKKTEELGAVQNELINIERIASLGKLSMSVAHEINNPLTGILTYTKLVQKQLNNQEVPPPKMDSMMKHLKIIETETKRCGDIVKGLLDFSRKDQKDFEAKNLHEVLRDTFNIMSHPMKIANVEFISHFVAEQDLVFCSPNQIKQACIALLVNSKEAITENGEIVIKTGNPDPDHIRIEISDNGSGIPEADLPHIFEPFFSSKQKAGGSGLGLSIVHGIVNSHKGKIAVHSVQGQSTTMTITLPLIKNKEN
jgi:two-component system, NtrC family, sensor kinase